MNKTPCFGVRCWAPIQVSHKKYNLTYIRSQHHGCWCPGGALSIRSHGINNCRYLYMAFWYVYVKSKYQWHRKPITAHNKQFSLQPAHPCFKIDHVGSSGKISYMFPVYMVITSENKKIIWKVVFKILTYFAKIRALFRHFMGVTQTSGKKTRKLRIPFTEMEQNSLI